MQGDVQDVRIGPEGALRSVAWYRQLRAAQYKLAFRLPYRDVHPLNRLDLV